MYVKMISDESEPGTMQGATDPLLRCPPFFVPALLNHKRGRCSGWRVVARLRVLPNKVTKTWPSHWTRTDLFLAVDAARHKMQWSSVFWLQNGDTSEVLIWGSLFGFVNGSAKSHEKITKPVHQIHHPLSEIYAGI